MHCSDADDVGAELLQGPLSFGVESRRVRQVEKRVGQVLEAVVLGLFGEAMKVDGVARRAEEVVGEQRVVRGGGARELLSQYGCRCALGREARREGARHFAQVLERRDRVLAAVREVGADLPHRFERVTARYVVAHVPMPRGASRLRIRRKT